MPTSAILLLDDNEADRTLIRQALMPAAPRRPFADSRDIAEALAWLRQRSASGPWAGTILLDWRLDPGCGAELLAAVRASPLLAGAEVIVLSSSESPEEQQRAMAAGADAWEIKPRDWRGYEQLARRIALGRGRFVNPCGSSAGAKGELSLSSAGRAVGLPAMDAAFPVVPHLLAAQITAAASENAATDQLLRQTFGLFAAICTHTVDREQAEIKAVCDRHRIRVSLALGHSRDQVVEAKRAAVLRDLIRLNWDDPTLIECFGVSKATLERRRAEVRESREGVVRIGVLGPG